MSNGQHVQHEATRLAAEVLVRGKGPRKREHRVNGGVLPAGVGRLAGLKAVGSIAYASVYTQRDGIKPRPAPPDFHVERRLRSGIWVVDKNAHCKTLEQARNYVHGFAKVSRVMVKNWIGAFNPDRGR